MNKAFDQEFREFFAKVHQENFVNSDVKKIYRPLVIYLRWRIFRKYTAIFFFIGILWALVQVTVINWNLVAVGRLFLIKLLPFWNWTHLHNAKCLIDYPIALAPNADDHVVGDKYQFDCSVCENIDTIYTTRDLDYTNLSEEFLERGLPVLLMDSHTAWPEDNFTQHLLTLEPLMESTPCEMSSNLIVRRLANLQELIERIQRMEKHSWFLHFHNCDFPAVKATRLIAPRPLFFPPHLEPAYSSWILMSHKYDHPAPKEITLDGIVLVRQLQGRGVFRLSGRGKCLEECGKYTVEVKSGEALLFTTDLWEFSYFPNEGPTKSVSFITETHFEV
ncbi:uncharacterized protein LOC129786925 [Lutzomyia longipalpis]|uniref:uncharacterized protein LOC129786925 n=1 Tax=Lutzomyia longipalpis TaxID=7200 RepID=UPI002483C5C2|nr:uncharacterized protein LOC129786925 [Lutzomyia longipalpis]